MAVLNPFLVLSEDAAGLQIPDTLPFRLEAAPAFPLSKVASPRHVCFTFTDRREHLRVVSHYVAEGLSAGERTLCFIEDLTLPEITSALEERGVDVAAQVALGALQITRARATYVQDECFNVDKMLLQIVEMFQRAQTSGYQRVRATGDMSWILAGDKGVDQVIAYEQHVSDMLTQLPGLTGMCQYDLGRFQAPFIREIVATHPLHVPHSLYA